MQIVCGEIRRPSRLGIAGVDAHTASANRCAALVRAASLMFVTIGQQRCDVGKNSGLNFSHVLTALAVDRHKGIVRCLLPLPR